MRRSIVISILLLWMTLIPFNFAFGGVRDFYVVLAARYDEYDAITMAKNFESKYPVKVYMSNNKYIVVLGPYDNKKAAYIRTYLNLNKNISKTSIVTPAKQVWEREVYPIAKEDPFFKVNTINTNIAQQHLDRANDYLQQGYKEHAIIECKKALDIDPANTNAVSMLDAMSSPVEAIIITEKALRASKRLKRTYDQATLAGFYVSMTASTILQEVKYKDYYYANQVYQHLMQLVHAGYIDSYNRHFVVGAGEDLYSNWAFDSCQAGLTSQANLMIKTLQTIDSTAPSIDQLKKITQHGCPP